MAHGKRFQLELQRDHSVFHDKLEIRDGDENVLGHIDTSHIYQGTIKGESEGKEKRTRSECTYKVCTNVQRKSECRSGSV